MVAFFGSWAVAILLILRWFHVLSTNRAWNDEPFADPIAADSPVIRRLRSSLS